jgi:hypothetical protein
LKLLNVLETLERQSEIAIQLVTQCEYFILWRLHHA